MSALSENFLSEISINFRYNNIIILDDLMDEATDRPVVFRLYIIYLPMDVTETLALSISFRTCFLRGYIIQILAKMPNYLL